MGLSSAVSVYFLFVCFQYLWMVLNMALGFPLSLYTVIFRYICMLLQYKPRSGVIRTLY